MSIKAKMIGLGVLVLVALVVVQLANYQVDSTRAHVASVVEEANQANDLRQEELLQLRDFTADLRAINTLAMDIIIEKDAGEVSAERKAEIDAVAKDLLGKLEVLDEIADTDAEKQQAQELRDGVTELVVEVMQKRLPTAVKEQGVNIQAVKDAFAEMDNRLDQQSGEIEDSIVAIIKEAKDRSDGNALQFIEKLGELERSHAGLILLAMDCIIDREDGKISDERLDELKSLTAEQEKLMPEITKLAESPQEKELAASLATGLPKFRGAIATDLKKLIEDGTATQEAARQTFEDFDEEIDADLTKMFAEIHAFEASVEEEMQEAADAVAVARQDGERRIATMRTAVYIGLVIFAVVILGVFFWVSRGILGGIEVVRAHLARYATGYVRPISEMAGRVESLKASKDECGQMIRAAETLREYLTANIEVAENIGQGNLDVDVHLVSENDMFGKAFTDMVRGLSEAIAQVHASVNEITAGAGQLNSASQLLAQNATEQAASLEEVTSSMTEMGSQVATNADNAQRANELASTANDAAIEGRDKMQHLAGAMEDITRSAEEVQKVNKVIDDIAFQTNLLALNAAVEAARAGVHGKGFAVVAEEVRNLAARSAKAANETSELINGVVRQIATGNTAAEQTAEALHAIADQVGQATSIVGEIASASKEQAQGISQINTGLSQIDQATQQNTANSEETAASAEEMAQIGAQLQEIMGRFAIDEKYHSGRSQTRGQRHRQWQQPMPTAGDFRGYAVNDHEIRELQPLEV